MASTRKSFVFATLVSEGITVIGRDHHHHYNHQSRPPIPLLLREANTWSSCMKSRARCSAGVFLSLPLATIPWLAESFNEQGLDPAIQRMRSEAYSQRRHAMMQLCRAERKKLINAEAKVRLC